MLKAFPAVAWRENSLLAAARGGYRAGAFVALSVSRPLRPVFRRNPEIPTRRTTPGLAASVLIDEIVIGVLPRALLSSDPDWLARARDDTEVTVAAAERNGWLHDPASFYRTPPPPAVVVVEPARFHHIRHELLSFDTGYEPPLGLAGGDRWLAIEQNRRVEARVLRHRGGARPWLFVLHGYTGGTPADMVALRALHFHRDLGFNVVLPVLPLHGGRRAGGRSGEGFFSFDYTANLHAAAQAVWDVRRCMAWAREAGATSVSLLGASLGGYMASLVAGVEDGLECVVAGIPLVDLAWSLRHRAPKHQRDLASS